MSRRHLNFLLAMNLKKLICKTILAFIVLAPFNPTMAFSQASQGADTAAIPAPPPNASGPTGEDGWWTSQPKENKLLYTNLTAAALIGVWGLVAIVRNTFGLNNAQNITLPTVPY